jgi:sarcosine oxidase
MSQRLSTAVGKADEASVIVVGLGVLGSALAQRLAKHGWRTVLVDQYPFGHARAASGTNTRIIRYAHGKEVADMRSAWEARSLWREIEQEAGVDLMLKTGMTWFAREDDTWEADSQVELEREGIPFEKIERGHAEQLFPDLGGDDLNYLLYEPEACVLQSTRSVRALCELALASGARFVGGCARPVNGGVDVDGQLLSGDRMVWACGAWTPKVFPDLIKGTVIQQDLFYFGVPLAWQTPGVPAWGEGAGAMTGHGDLYGRGFKLGADSAGPEFDPDTGERKADPNQDAAVRDYLAKRFPAIAHTPLVGTESCQTTILDAEVPSDVVVQAGQRMMQHPDHPNTWILGDGSGSAFKHGPAIARRMEELLA